ncbi:MAG: glucoamylase family protein [Chitinophagaceae bacterium]
MKALKNYYYNYGHFLWGEYGFRDAFDLTHNWCSEIYMALNQAPMVVMIENYRNGLLWKTLVKDPDVKQALEKIKRKQ